MEKVQCQACLARQSELVEFPYFINEWNKLKVGIRNDQSIDIFKRTRLFCIYDPVGVRLLTRLRLQLNHLNEHKLVT